MIVSGKNFLLLTPPLPPNHFNFDFFDNFNNSNAFHSFNLNFEQLICKKVLKFTLLANCCSDLFTEVKTERLSNSLGRFLER